MKYEAVIGLEVHAQLKTASKMFCACSTKFGAEPNTHTCPICWGMPGVLPVVNRKAVEFAVKMALTVNCKINSRSIFARKNYFYPDLPKNYQISQYEEPLAEHGWIEIESDGIRKRIGITRIHMEEDAGKLVHSESGRSFVDFNRCGVPLIEIVSEPDMRKPSEASSYLKALRDILVYLDICDGNMEEGSFRCDANVSIRPEGEKKLGVKVELKNMNSFRFVEKALEYEILRQMEVLRSGGLIVQETRLWDSDKQITYSMRTKEEAHDYRYFPEPDLLPIVLDEEWIEDSRRHLPELPDAKRRKFVELYGLPQYDATVLTAEKFIAEFFEEAVKIHPNPKAISNWIMGEMLREIKGEGAEGKAAIPIAPAHIAELVRLIDEKKITGKIAKTVFSEMWKTGKSPMEVVEEKGLQPVEDVEAFVDKILDEHPREVENYLKGKKNLMGFFVGQVMKATGGKADPKILPELIVRKLETKKKDN